MIAFEVLVNGEKICTAGVGERGGLNAIVSGPRLPGLRVGGLDGEEHLRWLEGDFKLEVGDEVTIRLVETEVVDEPLNRSVSQTRAERESKVKKLLEKARALLPESVDLKSYHERLSQNHLIGAMDVLEKLGEESGANSEFWGELSNVAHEQTAYEDRKRYSKKCQAMKAETESNQE